MPPLELLGDLLLRLVLPAMLVSGLVLALLLALGQRLPQPRWQHLAVPTSVGLGLLAGNWLRAPLPYWPDGAGWPWLMVSAMAALIISAVLHTTLPQQPLVRGALAVVPLVWCLTPQELRTPQWLPTLAAVALGNALGLEYAAARFEKLPKQGWLVPLSWAIVPGGAAAAVLIYSHSARLADAAILLASALMGVAAAGWRGSLDARPLALPVGLYLIGLMLNGHHSTFSEVPLASFVLVAAAPLALLCLALPIADRWPPWVQMALLFVLPLVPAAIGVALAIRAEGLAIGY